MSHDRLRAMLVCYDVRDPKRLRRVYQAMRGFGDHVQYSVFRCVLNDKTRGACFNHRPARSPVPRSCRPG